MAIKNKRILNFLAILLMLLVAQCFAKTSALEISDSSSDVTVTIGKSSDEPSEIDPNPSQPEDKPSDSNKPGKLPSAGMSSKSYVVIGVATVLIGMGVILFANEKKGDKYNVEEK